MKPLSCIACLVIGLSSTAAWAEPALSPKGSSPSLLSPPPSSETSTLQTTLLSTHKPGTQRNEKIALEEGEDVQYAIFRSNGDVYFKGRAGYLTDYTEEAFEDISIEEIIDSFDENGALGIGAGYTLKSGNKVELEYTVTKRSEQILQIEYLF